jgi:hypothetical protein
MNGRSCVPRAFFVYCSSSRRRVRLVVASHSCRGPVPRTARHSVGNRAAHGDRSRNNATARPPVIPSASLHGAQKPLPVPPRRIHSISILIQSVQCERERVRLTTPPPAKQHCETHPRLLHPRGPKPREMSRRGLGSRSFTCRLRTHPQHDMPAA